MRKNKRSIYTITAFLIMIIMGSAFIKQGLDMEKNMTPIYSYTAQKSDNYEVLLKPNTFYTTEKLPAGGYYASNSIKSYLIELRYNFKGDRKTNLEYNYNITANLIGTVRDNNNQDKEVWNREFIFKENVNNKQKETDEFAINEQLDIDYEYYNNLARSYEKTYKITIDAVLKIRLNVNIEMETEEDFIELEIPITSTVSEVRENYQKTTEKDINQPKENSETIKTIFYVIGGAFVIGALVIISIEINKNKKKSPLKRIFKYYNDLIVKVENKPNFEKLKTLNITTFEDLVDVAEQTQNIIIYYENSFYVVVGKYLYSWNAK